MVEGAGGIRGGRLSIVNMKTTLDYTLRGEVSPTTTFIVGHCSA